MRDSSQKDKDTGQKQTGAKNADTEKKNTRDTEARARERRGLVTSPLQLDGGWISAGLDRNADYPNPDGPQMGRVFMNRETGQFVGVLRDRDADDDASTKEREAIESSPVSWLEIPIPSHGQHHKCFRVFLGSIGCEDEYFGSIGRWLKEYGSDVRAELWSNFRSERVVDYVIARCRAAGIDAQVVSGSGQD